MEKLVIRGERLRLALRALEWVRLYLAPRCFPGDSPYGIMTVDHSAKIARGLEKLGLSSNKAYALLIESLLVEGSMSNDGGMTASEWENRVGEPPRPARHPERAARAWLLRLRDTRLLLEQNIDRLAGVELDVTSQLADTLDLRRFLEAFASGEITEEMLKEPRKEPAGSTA